MDPTPGSWVVGQAPGDRSKGPAMMGADPQSPKSRRVLGGSVTRIAFPAVARELSGQPGHQAVPLHLRHDGGRRDAATPGVAPRYGHGTARKVGKPVPVDQGALRPSWKGEHGPAHRQQGCVEDVQPVDFAYGRPPDSHLGVGFDGAPKPHPNGSGQSFRILDPGRIPVPVQNNRRRHHGTGPRPPPDLIDPAHASAPAGLLQRMVRHSASDCMFDRVRYSLVHEVAGTVRRASEASGHRPDRSHARGHGVLR